MCRLACVGLCLLRASVSAHVVGDRDITSAPPPPFANDENNVAGSMPTPAGSPAHGVVLVGTMTRAGSCAAAVQSNSTYTSWTYHHCNFPPAGSGNYSCHCYGRNDGRWAPVSQALVDSGFIKAAPQFRCSTNWDCQLNGHCNAGVCHCDAAWSGDRCQRILQGHENGRGSLHPPHVGAVFRATATAMHTVQRNGQDEQALHAELLRS